MKKLGAVVCLLLFASACGDTSETSETPTTTVPSADLAAFTNTPTTTVLPATSTAAPKTTSVNAEWFDEVSSDEWLKKYSPNVKKRIDEMETDGDCFWLQREFEVAFDNDSITRAKHGSGNEDLMIYINNAIENTECNGNGDYIHEYRWCNKMRIGYDPAALWLVSGAWHGDVESFVLKARGYQFRNCSEQLENSLYISWAGKCGPPVKSDDCEDWRD